MKLDIIDDIIHKLNESLNTPKELGETELLRCIKVCIQSYQEIKAIIRNYEFESTAEEIHFFKYMKPQVMSKYFFYLKIYKIETALPMSSMESKLKYYTEELKKLDHYINNNKEFCKYIRSGSTYMDQIYFTRGVIDPTLITNYQSIEIEHEFVTSRGFVLARIQATDDVYRFVYNKIRLLESNYALVDSLIKPTPWKGSKVNMVVLLYGLIETKQVDCDINTLAAQFQKVFDVELKDFYRMWADVKARKKESFPWLKDMMSKLELRKMEE